jgi:hypothetical protein
LLEEANTGAAIPAAATTDTAAIIPRTKKIDLFEFIKIDAIISYISIVLPELGNKSKIFLKEGKIKLQLKWPE